MVQTSPQRGVNMWYRTFLACAVASLSIALGGAHLAGAQTAAAPSASFELQIDEVYNKRPGGEVEFSIVFRDPLTREYNPTLKVIEGERVTIKLVNRTHSPRSFAIMGIKGADAPPVAAGAQTTLRFQAPARGTYIYHDPGKASLADARTLFGDFIVSPKPGH
jgi:FtsP/CotA-like multicopper oxidase with cupredoxin domain